MQSTATKKHYECAVCHATFIRRISHCMRMTEKVAVVEKTTTVSKLTALSSANAELGGDDKENAEGPNVDSFDSKPLQLERYYSVTASRVNV